MNEFIQELESVKKQVKTLHALTAAQQKEIIKLNYHQELREAWGPDDISFFLDEYIEMYIDALDDTDKIAAKDIKVYVINVAQECGEEHWEEEVNKELKSRKEMATEYGNNIDSDQIPF